MLTRVLGEIEMFLKRNLEKIKINTKKAKNKIILLTRYIFIIKIKKNIIQKIKRNKKLMDFIKLLVENYFPAVLLLVIIKIVYYLVKGANISIIMNYSLLFLLLFVAMYYNLNLKLRYHFYRDSI